MDDHFWALDGSDGEDRVEFSTSSALVSDGGTHPPSTGRRRRSTTVSCVGPQGGIFERIFAELAGAGGLPSQVMLDATNLKAHRTAASLKKGGRRLAGWDGRSAG